MLWESKPGAQELEAESEMERPGLWSPTLHPEHPQGDLKYAWGA